MQCRSRPTIWCKYLLNKINTRRPGADSLGISPDRMLFPMPWGMLIKTSHNFIWLVSTSSLHSNNTCLKFSFTLRVHKPHLNLDWSIFLCIVFGCVPKCINDNIINLYCRLPKYMARYTEDPIFKYTVYTMILKNYKKKKKKKVHVGNTHEMHAVYSC